MTAARKMKLSITLSKDLVAQIDREAGGPGARSRVVERWLRRAARLQAESNLERATIAYYESLTHQQRADDEAISKALTRSARRTEIDDRPAAVPRASRRRSR